MRAFVQIPTHNTQHLAHIMAGMRGPPPGVLDMYTQKYTDQVNQLLTTEATDKYPMHKHCAIA